MVKAKKTVFYVLLSISLALIAVTLILLFVPEPKPVTITEKFYITEDYELRGKIKNVSGKEIMVDRLAVSLHVKSPLAGSEYDSEYRLFDQYGQELTLQPNEEYEIRETLRHLDGDTFKITLVTAYVDNSAGINLYGKIVNDGKFAIAAVFVGFVGGVLLIGAFSNLIGNIVIAKRANQIISDLSSRFGGGIYAAGYYSDKKQDRVNAAKSALGIIGGAAMQLVTGVGIYHTQTSRWRRNFVITPAALYEVNGKKLEYTNLMPLVQVNFANAPVIEKGNKLTMTGADGRSYLTFMPEKDEKQKLIEALNALFTTQEN